MWLVEICEGIFDKTKYFTNLSICEYMSQSDETIYLNKWWRYLETNEVIHFHSVCSSENYQIFQVRSKMIN